MTNNLKELTQQVTPGDVVSTYGVRKAMGISAPRPHVGSSLVDLTEGACPVSEGGGLSAGLLLHVVSVSTTFSSLQN